jgi:hypothetical protein
MEILKGTLANNRAMSLQEGATPPRSARRPPGITLLVPMSLVGAGPCRDPSLEFFLPAMVLTPLAPTCLCTPAFLHESPWFLAPGTVM